MLTISTIKICTYKVKLKTYNRLLRKVLQQGNKFQTILQIIIQVLNLYLALGNCDWLVEPKKKKKKRKNGKPRIISDKQEKKQPLSVATLSSALSIPLSPVLYNSTIRFDRFCLSGNYITTLDITSQISSPTLCFLALNLRRAQKQRPTLSLYIQTATEPFNKPVKSAVIII